jgi:H+/Cl- antiporter ClcA
MGAIYYKNGVIRPVVAVITGAAVGRKGPIIQVGSAIGSTLGQIARMTLWQRITLVAAGAGAGIASAFNTPIGGVMFAIGAVSSLFVSARKIPFPGNRDSSSKRRGSNSRLRDSEFS